MAKVSINPTTVLYPVPAVMVTVGDMSKANIITLAWVGTVCSTPPMVGISIRPGRRSADMIKANGEFVVNLPNEDLVYVTDRCGMISGRDVDKWEDTTLKPVPARIVKPPLIDQCPVNIECVVRQTIPLGSHDLYLGEIVAIHADERVVDANGRLDARKARAVSYIQAEYWSLGRKLESHGFSTKR